MCQNRTGIGLVLRASGWFWHGSGPIILASGLKPEKNVIRTPCRCIQHVDNQKIMRRQQTTVLWANTNFTCHIDLSVCCPCWFRIWQLNCQNNFLASGSAGGISMKIATKFDIVGSILVWHIHINTFLARAIIKLTVFHWRFATMSPEMREMEHGGCRIASPARAVRALFRLESWATRAGEVDRGTSASSRMTGSAPRCAH